MMMVKHIENGTVIDHINAGKALEVLKIIGGPNSSITVIAINVLSTKHGRKDILKMEDVYIDKKKLDLISLIAPNATVDVIKNGKVAEKRQVKLPKEVSGVLKCLNPKCITNKPREPAVTKFIVKQNPLRLICAYCNKEFEGESLLKA
ncbi:MAG: aspartate carbamoyltransferase regulatory subunit [Candidatus Diapherotrites archaeon]|nr:aspartate carbamoyltransferase regulatory subunit [Candidatus Diapherotrites archaeon]